MKAKGPTLYDDLVILCDILRMTREGGDRTQIALHEARLDGFLIAMKRLMPEIAVDNLLAQAQDAVREAAAAARRGRKGL